jgi:ATP-dependent Clp protease ATP-binding subunit ClpC
VQQARSGEIKPCIGRKEEMIRIIRTLEREKKNNAVLVGDAGVGKTAIVQGIAYRIATGNIPPPFQNKRIIQINASSLVGETKYRGEFEERMNTIILEASASPDIILFIDEMHLLVGAGSAGGAMDAANILKPALSEGKIKLIGATTPHEYRQYIEKDAALEHRFQKITVKEPTIEQTKIILTGIIPRLKNHHKNIEITNEAIDAAIQLSVRYMPNRHLPDKAYDVLDEACSRARFKDVSYRHCKEDADKTLSCIITKELIAGIISEMTGIPVTQMSEEESQRFKHMAAIIKKRVVGQDQAVESVAQIIKNHRLGLTADKNKPMGVFLFTGPTGVGKTELSKALAQFLFGTEENIIRLDMSEYMEKHMVVRLIGSPPGFVGFEQGGQLTEALYKMPYAIVLLDEIEKAHPDVLNIFLQVFSDGRLTDGQGRTIDAKDAVFIMTSNLGYIKNTKSHIGYQADYEISENTIKTAINGHFTPEFINRLDEIIFFNKLDKTKMSFIVEIQVHKLSTLLQEKYDIKLAITDRAKQWLCEKGYDEQLGARPLIRFIQKNLINEIAGDMLNDKIRPTHIINIDIQDDQIKIDAYGTGTK